MRVKLGLLKMMVNMVKLHSQIMFQKTNENGERSGVYMLPFLFSVLKNQLTSYNSSK